MKYLGKLLVFLIIMIFGVTLGSLIHLKLTIKISGEELGSLADWVSGLGTIVAVIVSLYLASRWNKDYIRFSMDGNRLNISNLSNDEVKLAIQQGSEYLEVGPKYVMSLRPVNTVEYKNIQDFEELGPQPNKRDCDYIEIKDDSFQGTVNLSFFDQVKNIKFKLKT